MGSLHQEQTVAVSELLFQFHQLEKNIAVKVGLSVDELHCLTQLYTQTPYCVKKLSELMGTTASRTSRLLQKLEQGGYLTRSLSPDDKRKEQISLTEKGVRTVERILAASDESFEHLFSSLPVGLSRFVVETLTSHQPLISP